MPQPPLLIELIEEGSSPTGTAATPDFDTLDKLRCLWRTTLANRHRYQKSLVHRQYLRMASSEFAFLHSVFPFFSFRWAFAERRRSFPKAIGIESPRPAPRALLYTAGFSLPADLDSVSRGNATTARAGNAG